MPRNNEPLWSAGLIFCICVLSFGLQIPRLGFYWDDYASLYLHTKFGDEGLTDLFSGQARPLAGQLGAFLWNTIGANPAGWHTVNFALTLIATLTFWRILRLLWPGYKTQTTLIALLFAVYPSYHLRPIAISFYLIIALTLFLISFWLSLVAAQKRSIPLAIAAALMIPIYQMIYEQNIPYEALRPLAMGWILFRGTQVEWRSYLSPLLKLWFPYPLITLAVLFYRFIIFEPDPTYERYNQIQFNSLDTILLVFKRSVVAPIDMLLMDWIQVPHAVFSVEKIDADIPGLMAALFTLVAILYFWKHQDWRVQNTKTVLVVGALAAGMIPVLLLSIHLVGRALEVGFNSRWALSPTPLAALVVGLAVPRLVRSAALGQLLLLGLVVFGVAIQTGINQAYVADWELRRDLWWQLQWRAPHLAPDTLVVIYLPREYLAFDRVITDYEVTTHTNLHYSGENYPYVVGASDALVTGLLISGRPLEGIWSDSVSLNPDVSFRNWAFDLDNAVVFGYDGGCLHTANPTFPSQSLSIMDNLAQFHHPERILDISSGTAAEVVEPEPEKTWCYYYQQIQRALDLNQNEQAAKLADEAKGFSPVFRHEIEWLPVIEAYNRVGRDVTQYLYAIATLDSQTVLCERLKVQLADKPEILEAQTSLLPQCHP